VKIWHQPSIFWRLYAVELGVVTLVWVAFGALVVADSRRTAREQLDRDVTFLAESLANITSLAPDANVGVALGETLRNLQQRKSTLPMDLSDVTYQVWSADGRLIARSQDQHSPGDFGPGTLPLGRSVERSGWIVAAETSQDRRIIAVVGESTPYRAKVANAAMRKFLYPYLILALSLAVVVWVAMRYGLRPLRELAATVAARSEADLSPCVPVRSYLELEPLLSALNGMFARIQRMLEAQREFFADAAHELRTPLAVLSAQAHVVAHESEPAARLAAAKALDEGITRAANVLQRLLLLARLDATKTAKDRTPTDIADLIGDVVTIRGATAKATAHELTSDVQGPLLLRCNSSDLRMALDCLIDNGLKHTPPGSQVSIAANIADGEVVIAVTDNGPGIPPELQERAFRRFERLGATQEGSGLGLAIVRRVTELHGGRVLLKDGPGGRGCRFEIRIPLVA
jgi:two-component system OmpR family sensor kinase